MITIRKAKSTEYLILQDLNNEVFIDNAKYDPDIVVDWAHSVAGTEYFQELVKDAVSICLVAETEEGRLIGYIAGSNKPISYRVSRYFEIDNMGVIPEYRSQGIGKKLIDECLAWAKENGYQKVFVNSYLANIKAISFYEKCGFSPIDISLEKKI